MLSVEESKVLDMMDFEVMYGVQSGRAKAVAILGRTDAGIRAQFCWKAVKTERTACSACSAAAILHIDAQPREVIAFNLDKNKIAVN